MYHHHESSKNVVYFNFHTFVLSSIFEVIFLSLFPAFSETTATSVGASVLSASSCFAEILVSEKLLEHVIIPDMLCS